MLEPVRYADQPIEEISRSWCPGRRKRCGDSVRCAGTGNGNPNFLICTTLLKGASFKSECEIRIVAISGTEKLAAHAAKEHPDEFRERHRCQISGRGGYAMQISGMSRVRQSGASTADQACHRWSRLGPRRTCRAGKVVARRHSNHAVAIEITQQAFSIGSVPTVPSNRLDFAITGGLKVGYVNVLAQMESPGVQLCRGSGRARYFVCGAD